MIELIAPDRQIRLAATRLQSPVSIGRDPHAHMVLAHWRVARRHAVLLERSRTLWIQDLGTWSGTWVNRKRIVADTPLLEGDLVVIGPLSFRARWIPDTSVASSERKATHKEISEPLGFLNDDPSLGASAYDFEAMTPRPGREFARPEVWRREEDAGPAKPGETGRSSEQRVLESPVCSARLEEGHHSGGASGHRAETLDGGHVGAIKNGMPTGATGSGQRGGLAPTLGAGLAGVAVTPCVEGTDTAQAAPTQAVPTQAAPAQAVAHDATEGAVAIRQALQLRLLNAMDLRREDVSMMSDQHLRARARAILQSLIERDPTLCPEACREPYIEAVIDEAVGLGPLEPLLADHSVSEIMVNRHDEIYVERAGCLERVNVAFASPLSVLAVLERIVAPLGRRIDEGAPMVDARLADGSRVNGVIGPIALKGPTLTIRKFSRRRMALDDLVDSGALSSPMAGFLKLCVVHKKNIVVSGGTGSGKTTLLNILSGLIGARERIITIEDAAELQLPHAHVVSLEARPPNIEGRGRIDIRDLVRNALRMRPDRIVVGECRGAEAFDMLAAMNTGHEGSLTTLHANTPRDALARLETMILMAGMPLPLAAVREHISSGIDIIIQQARLEDGRRVLTDVAEVSGMDSGGIQLQSLFVRHKGHGGFEGTGVLPSFLDAWRERGIDMPAQWFDRQDAVASR